MKPKKLTLFALSLIAMMLLVGAASADTFQDSWSSQNVITYSPGLETGMTGPAADFNKIWFSNSDLSNYVGLAYIGCDLNTIESAEAKYSVVEDTFNQGFNLFSQGDYVGSGHLDYYVETNANPIYHTVSIALWFDDFDPQPMIDNGKSYCDLVIASGKYYTASATGSINNALYTDSYLTFVSPSSVANPLTASYSGTHSESYASYAILINQEWEFAYYTNYEYGEVNNIELTPSYTTTFNISYDGNFHEYYTGEEVSINYFLTPLGLNITNPITGSVISETIGGGTAGPGEANVLTHVWSTGDNSLIAGVNVTYSAVDGSDYQSQILTSGEGTFTLQKYTDYSFYASAEGYRSQTSTPPTVSFTGNTQYGDYLVPIEEEVESGDGTLNFHVTTYTSSGSTTPLAGAAIVINDQTLITNSAGFAQLVVNKTSAINYVVTKGGYQSVSRIYTPSWPSGYDYIDEWVTLRAGGTLLPGEATAEPTTDTRTNEAKADSALNIIFDNLEFFATMTVMVLVVCYFEWMTPKTGKSGRRRR